MTFKSACSRTLDYAWVDGPPRISEDDHDDETARVGNGGRCPAFDDGQCRDESCRNWLLLPILQVDGGGLRAVAQARRGAGRGQPRPVASVRRDCHWLATCAGNPVALMAAAIFAGVVAAG